MGGYGGVSSTYVWMNDVFILHTDRCEQNLHLDERHIHSFIHSFCALTGRDTPNGIPPPSPFPPNAGTCQEEQTEYVWGNMQPPAAHLSISTLPRRLTLGLFFPAILQAPLSLPSPSA